MNPSIRGVLLLSNFLKSGQIVIGASKGYYCTGDGEVREFGKGGGGVPIYGTDFTYTGDYIIIDDTESGSEESKWRIKFLSSGTFIPRNNMIIDVFLCGGGGGAVGGDTGGGGGYTTTSKSVVLSSGVEYPIVVGNAGSVAVTDTNGAGEGGEGGTSSGFSVIAKGGGAARIEGTTKANGWGYYYCGSGGSGGGWPADVTVVSWGKGGVDGGNGSVRTRSSSDLWYAYAGTGQGTTTREFAETTGDLYASGGGCDLSSVTVPNSGNGGGTGDAAAGIVVIRNHRE